MDLTTLMTPAAVGLNIFLYFSILILLWPYIRKYATKSSSAAAWGTALMVLFCVFSFWDTDYFHYLSRFDWLHNGNLDASMEEIYTWIAERSSSYSIFRLFVWGASIFFCYILAHNLKIPYGLFLLFLAGGFITKFSYGRVTLAMAILFVGLSFITSTIYPRVLKLIIGFSLIGCSFFFHKSAPFGIAIATASIFAYLINKTTLKIYLIAYPILILIFGFLVAHILQFSPTDESAFNISAAQNYLNHERQSSGIGALLGNALAWSPYYLTVWLFCKCVFRGIFRNFSYRMKVFGTAAFLTTSIATLFAFDLGANTYTYFYRFLFFAMIPSAVFLTQCSKNRIYPKFVFRTLCIAAFGVSYQLLYSFYLSVLGAQTF